jgi:uncharacterized protein (TIGR00369 family)
MKDEMKNETMRTRTVTWRDPQPLAGAAKTMSGLERLQAVASGALPPAPLAALVGITLVSVEPGCAVFEGKPAEYHYNLGGVAHGGFACTLLDSALGCSVTSLLPAGRSCATTDLHVRFVRSLTAQTGLVRCEARVLHLGRTIATAEGRLTDAAGKLYAHATTACAIFDET